MAEIQNINREYGAVRGLMDSGQFETALERIREIQKDYRLFEDDVGVGQIISALLIDAGSALRRPDVVQEGTDILKKHYNEMVANERYAFSANYNLANGLSSLFQTKRYTDPWYGIFAETERDEALSYYRKATLCEKDNAHVMSQLWTNIGNTLSAMGRSAEALDCYERAVQYEEKHGMAIGNMGKAMAYYARVVGEHCGTYLSHAYRLIDYALRLGVDPEAKSYFEAERERIKKYFSKPEVLEEECEYPGIEVTGDNELEKYLLKFCLENRLYINLCTFCQKCNAAVGDTAQIQEMTVNLNERDSYLWLSSKLNQIKQDYVSARFLLVLSQQRSTSLKFVDKRVFITDTMDYETHNIYVQLLKNSFKLFYDILDKAALFISDYLKLGIDERYVQIHTIWNPEVKGGGFNSKIRATQNYALNAIYKIAKEQLEGDRTELRTTRHHLTHGFLRVVCVEPETPDEITEKQLFERTIELAKIVRSVIIYLISTVFIEEKKKKAGRGDGIAMPLLARNVDDEEKY